MKLAPSKSQEIRVKRLNQPSGCKQSHVREAAELLSEGVCEYYQACPPMPRDCKPQLSPQSSPTRYFTTSNPSRTRAGALDVKMKLCPSRKFKRKLCSPERSFNIPSKSSIICVLLFVISSTTLLKDTGFFVRLLPFVSHAEGSLIIGDSAIEIQEVDDGSAQNKSPANEQATLPQNNLLLASTSETVSPTSQNQLDQDKKFTYTDDRRQDPVVSSQMRGPLPPIVAQKGPEDVTDGDKKSRANHDYDLSNMNAPLKLDLTELNSHELDASKPIAGKVVDFELTPAGGHNKAKIKKKKKKKKEESMHKKWAKKKKSEKKAMEKKHKESMKKKKEEGKKGKKKWGKEEHGQKKKGNFNKKKWGKKVKKGKGVKKGKKGKKFLKDKGHKNTGFKTVYHKEEWGKSSKWHDIKREKKWDEKAKKWKKKWKKEKGKKYKGDHMKKFEKKKKSGKKYKKEKKDKYKKFKKEEFKKGMKKKKEEHGKKKEGGVKKEMKEMKKKKKKKG